MSKRITTYLIHIVGSLGFLAIPLLVSPDSVSDGDFFRHVPAVMDLLSHLFLLIFFYVNYYVLIPKLYFKRYYFAFAGILVFCFVAVTVLPVVGARILVSEPARNGAQMHLPPPPPIAQSRPAPPPHDHSQENIRPDQPRPNQMPNQDGPDGHPRRNMFFLQLEYSIIRFVLVVVLSLFLRISARWRQERQEKAQAELAYLKAQINPHFLFNTLNGIYALAIQRSDATAPAIVKLSEMMRYVTTESQNENVPLEKEIKYLQNYIDLQKIRAGDTVKITFTIQGETMGKQLAPLILIPFVENAFKYGVNPEEQSEIRILIDVFSDAISLDVWNQKVRDVGTEAESTGFGISNATQRLELAYPGKYMLSVEDTNETYRVRLQLKLL